MPRITTALTAAITLVAISASWASSPPPRELRPAAGVVALGVGGNEVAYALERCGALRVWSLARRRVTPITAQVVDCSADSAWYGDVAVTRSEIVWSALESYNHLYAGVHVASPSRPGASRTIYTGADEGIGALAADGAVVAFSTQAGSYGVDGARATLWVGDTRRVSSIREVIGWMDNVAVEGDLVAVGYRNGRVEVFRTSGAAVRSFPPGTAARGVELDGGRIVALSDRLASVHRLDSRNPALARPIQRSPRGVALLDARAGLVAYRSGGKLRLLRLSDGRDIRVSAPGADRFSLHARFGASGLVLAYPRVLRVITWRQLRRLLSRAG